jgi:hypothetical protein
MNQKLDIIRDFERVSASLAGCDAETHAAWTRVRSLAGAAASPPSGQGGAPDAAANFSEYLHRMGLAGLPPRTNSQGMEQLLWRWVVVAESFEGLLRRIIQEDAPGARATAPTPQDGMWGRQVVAYHVRPRHCELYQTSYCDGCGGELAPDGRCANCGAT